MAVRHDGAVRLGHGRSWVELRPLDTAEIEAYVASGAADGKAGGLEVQGGAAPFVSRWGGCWANVLGLPVAVVLRLLDVPLGVHPCVQRSGPGCRLCPAPPGRHGPPSPAAAATSAATAP